MNMKTYKTKTNILSFLVLALAALSVNAQPKEVHILSVNDMHAAIDRFPKFTMVVDSLRSEHPDLLLLAAGDNRTGNPVNDKHEVPSKPMVEFMNLVGFDYSAIGNHEFDGGVDNFRSVINSSDCRYLCANMQAPDSLNLDVRPLAVTERNGVRIGILGLLQINSYSGYPDAHPKVFGPIKFESAPKAANKYAWIDSQCDVLILLTHNGIEDDIALAKHYPEPDLIVGGHSHSLLEPCVIENGVMITQAERWLKYATHIILSVENGRVINRKAELIDVANYPKEDPKALAMLEEFNSVPTLSRVLTQSLSDLGSKEELGCLMADAMRNECGVDIAIQNSGGVRYDSKPKGNFTVNDVYKLDPFENEVYEYELSGDEVAEFLKEICITDDYGPAFVSGIKYEITLGKDNKDVREVRITMPDGSKFNTQKKYKVVASSYIGSTAKFSKSGTHRNTFMVQTECLMNYLSKQPAIDYKGADCVEIKKAS